MQVMPFLPGLSPVEAVNTVAPVLQFVHVDHLHRPVKMTNAAKAVIWDAVWQPFGGLHSLTGAASNNLRFPGQWLQAETGLHYNWHRSYDPTLGRYTQPDPLGFVDGPSVYAYARSNPNGNVDPTGQFSALPLISLPPLMLPPASPPSGGSQVDCPNGQGASQSPLLQQAKLRRRDIDCLKFLYASTGMSDEAIELACGGGGGGGRNTTPKDQPPRDPVYAQKPPQGDKTMTESLVVEP